MTTITAKIDDNDDNTTSRGYDDVTRRHVVRHNDITRRHDGNDDNTLSRMTVTTMVTIMIKLNKKITLLYNV